MDDKPTNTEQSTVPAVDPGHGSPGHRHTEGGKDDGHSHAGLFGANTEMAFALICGLLLAAGAAIGKWVAGAPAWLPLACYVAAYFFGGFFTLREAIGNLRKKRFEIDTLMLVAAAGAAALGSWGEGALLLFLFSLGHALEHYAMGRAKRAIEALAELAPTTAVVRRDGQPVEIPVEQLIPGDVVLVRPNERLPADGFVVLGTSSINQAPVTGESIPVDKRPVPDVALARARPDAGVDAASRVFAGTINGAGAIEIEVTRRSGDSALARVVRLVSEAETRQSATQRFTDKFERIFVPLVLLLAVVLLFAWVVVDEPFRDSFYRSMAVLVAASPCALAIATPSAVLSGIARAARSGVLIKGGAPLEELGALQAMAFDKTGTLTEGRPRITDVVPGDGIDPQELLSVAVAVEALSDHPLAAAIVRDGRERLETGVELPAATDLRSLTGQGVVATIAGETVWIGKAEMFGSGDAGTLGQAATAAVAQLREAGRTTMVVRRGNRDLGVIGLMDTPRAGAREALQQLRELGITRMVMISGDHTTVAQAVAKDVGLDEAWGNLMPEDKVSAIRKLRAQAPVAMVGDGVNDAPAMANASVGIAMGAAGSDVALETADVALMADDLRHLPFAVGLSRHTRGVIRQNVFVSLGIVAFLVPATIMGLGIGAAVAVHEGSTLLVVINALRLLAYRDPLRQQA
ncbi:heavy metal translocating P-type ATPase [Comamonas sp. 4034]|uniref:heavy metal translocating P-type ATPase n=1 Tax=Comamonas sp. 4034 TaxID=3156455 RepID=UPI003D215C90